MEATGNAIVCSAPIVRSVKLRLVGESDFDGKLIIEREAGDDRVKDIRCGAAFITPLLEGGAV